MDFHNPTDRPQRFELGNKTYEVPKGGNVSLPDNLAYVVKQRKMPLREGPHPDSAAPRARVLEALPSEVEQLLGSPRITPEQREAFRADWRRVGARERANMTGDLRRVSEGFASLGAEGDEGNDGEQAAPGAQAAEDDEERGVDAGLDEAVKVVGPGRRQGRRER